jgi:hypothetical protein
MQKKIYLLGNSIIIEDALSGEKDYTGIQFFSFEIVGTTIQLVDSSQVKEVISLNESDFLDKAGTPVGDADAIETYLSDFSESTSVVISGDSKVQLVDENGDSVPVDKDVFATDTQKGVLLVGEDKDGIMRRIRVEADGRLISSASVVNPPGTTQVNQSVQSNVGTTDDSDYVIPNGELLIIQQFSGGAEGDVDGSKVELFVFEDGTKTVGQLLDVVYVNGSNGSDSINQGFVGDGSRLVTIRRSRLAGSGKEIFGKWQGYY